MSTIFFFLIQLCISRSIEITTFLFICMDYIWNHKTQHSTKCPCFWHLLCSLIHSHIHGWENCHTPKVAMKAMVVSVETRGTYNLPYKLVALLGSFVTFVFKAAESTTPKVTFNFVNIFFFTIFTSLLIYVNFSWVYHIL